MPVIAPANRPGVHESGSTPDGVGARDRVVDRWATRRASTSDRYGKAATQASRQLSSDRGDPVTQTIAVRIIDAIQVDVHKRWSVILSVMSRELV